MLNISVIHSSVYWQTVFLAIECTEIDHKSCDRVIDHKVCDRSHMENNDIAKAQVNRVISFADTNIIIERELNEGFD